MRTRPYIGPQVLRAGKSIITREEAMRVDRFVQKVGNRATAAKRLGVGYGTIELACLPGSTLLEATKAKLFEALEREERAA